MHCHLRFLQHIVEHVAAHRRARRRGSRPFSAPAYRGSALWLGVVCLVALGAPAIAVAQPVDWRRLDQPYGGTVWGFVDGPDGSVLASVADDGIRRSTDDGLTWRPFGPVGNVRVILYAHRAIFAVDPGSGAVLRAAESDTGWTTLPLSGALAKEPLIETRAGSLVFVGTRGIQRSVDEGRTWSPVGPRDSSFRFAASSASGVLYAVGERGSIFRSSDDGATWAVARTSDGSKFDASVVLPGGQLVVSNHGSLYVSDDGGATFRFLTVASTSGSTVEVAVMDESTLLVGTATGAVMASVSGEKMDLRNVVPWRSLQAVHVTRAGVELLGYHGRGLYRSTDDGATFSATGLSPGWQITSLSEGPDGALFAAVVDTTGRIVTTALFRSTDRGSTWIDARLYEGRPTRVAAATESIVVGVSDRSSFTSTDRGETWEHYRYNVSLDDVVGDGRGTAIGFGRTGIATFDIAARVWRGTPFISIDAAALSPGGQVRAVGGEFLVSTDAGRTWRTEAITAPRRLEGSRRQIVTPGDSVIVLLERVAPPMLARSTDAGRSWDTTGFRCDSGMATIADGGVRGVFISSACGVLHSTDEGATWRAIGERPAGESDGTILAHSSGDLFYAGATGIHVGRLPSAVEMMPGSNSESTGIAIVDIDETSVTLRLTTPQPIGIVISSIGGETLRLLPPGFLATGVHRLDFPSLASGIFFVSVRGRLTATTRLVRVVR